VTCDSVVKILINEKRARFLKHLVRISQRHFSNCVKDHVLFDGEKSLRTDEAGLIDLAAFAIHCCPAGRRKRPSTCGS